MNIASLFETAMVLCFGISWPLSIIRSYRSRSTKGKSVLFSGFILLGYICGITAKILSRGYNLAFAFYILNGIMVAVDICLWFRNRAIERAEG